MIAPLSLIVSAFAPVRRRAPRRSRRSCAATRRDRAGARRPRRAASNRLGGSALAQVYGQLGDDAPDLDDPALLRGVLRRDPGARRERHCCSPTTTAPTAACSSTLLEMAFAVALRPRRRRSTTLARAMPLARAVHRGAGRGASQVRARATRDARARRVRATHGLRRAHAHRPRRSPATAMRIARDGAVAARRGARRPASRAGRDDARDAAAARRPGRAPTRSTTRILDADDPGLHADARPSIRPTTSPRRSSRRGARPRVAILREQGVNGQVEMAAAFDRAGFDAVDVHMSDLIDGRVELARLQGPRRLRRLLVRRRARRRRGLGEVDPVQRARARRVRGVLRARATRSRSASATAAR